ncbi:hypothetical protein L210DRAFT_148819 [Boletus edulis BED1]|uniref:Uncharacterized protein n=1 Tax=Boletus edulis BED1 TaxID=1328754 RepID=A0AAD4G659_BOLED|nr:hypothetical protein L210DRAFT_148819 [Boletus edulis BED1]
MCRYDGICSRSDGNARAVETDTQTRRDQEVQGANRDVEHEPERQSDGDGVHMSWKRGGTDGAIGAARREPKRLETTSPATRYQADSATA